MMRQTGGLEPGATSTRSSPSSSACLIAASGLITPSCSPPLPITRTSGSRILSLTRGVSFLAALLISVRRCSSSAGEDGVLAPLPRLQTGSSRCEINPLQRQLPEATVRDCNLVQGGVRRGCLRRGWGFGSAYRDRVPDTQDARSATPNVSTSKPSPVTAIVCSHCALSERSLVTTVQPSGIRRV